MALRERVRGLFGSALAFAGLTLLRAAGAVQPEEPKPEDTEPDVSRGPYPPVALSPKAQSMLAEGIAPKPRKPAPTRRVLRGSIEDRMKRGDR